MIKISSILEPFRNRIQLGMFERIMEILIDKFRPISLLPIVGNIMEKVITKRLTEVTERLKWLPKFQNGFEKRKQLSTI